VLSSCIYIFHRNHSPFWHCTVLLLLFYSPGSCFPCETGPISLHKPSRTVNKPPDDFNWASIENLKSPHLGCCKICLWMFSIPVFTPSPVLNSIMSIILSNIIGYCLPWGSWLRQGGVRCGVRLRRWVSRLMFKPRYAAIMLYFLCFRSSRHVSGWGKFSFFDGLPAVNISILSQGHQQRMKRSRLVIFPDFSRFFQGYRQILEGHRGQNLNYQELAQVNNS